MDFDQLATLEHLRSLASQREFAKLRHKEAELRQQLSALHAYRTDLHAPDPGLRQMRAIGADVLWNKWLDQTQRTLNMSLARVLAQKDAMMAKVRRDVGRAETVRALHDQHIQNSHIEQNKRRLSTVMEQAVQQVTRQRV